MRQFISEDKQVWIYECIYTSWPGKPEDVRVVREYQVRHATSKKVRVFPQGNFLAGLRKIFLPWEHYIYIWLH